MRFEFAVLAVLSLVACDAVGGSGAAGTGGSGGATIAAGHGGDPYYPSPCDGPCSMPEGCDALPCTGDGHTPNSGCFECAVFGDSATAPSGGKCAATFQQCFGTTEDCSPDMIGNPECCAFAACLDACPVDDPMTPDDEYWDCTCTNDGMGCTSEPPDSTTCLGMHPSGVSDYVAFYDCIAEVVCSNSCGD